MSEAEVAIWLNAYWLLAIIGVAAWCIGAFRQDRREHAQRKRIERIMEGDGNAGS